MGDAFSIKLKRMKQAINCTQSQNSSKETETRSQKNKKCHDAIFQTKKNKGSECSSDDMRTREKEKNSAVSLPPLPDQDKIRFT